MGRPLQVVLVGILISGTTGPLRAQSLAFQVPVQQRFGLQTTVSVPDRGRGLLGSISRARSSWQRRGFLRQGSSLGYERSRTTITARAWIHDLSAMDRALLEQCEQKRQPVRTGRLSPLAAHAWQTLSARREPPRTAAATRLSRTTRSTEVLGRGSSRRRRPRSRVSSTRPVIPATAAASNGPS